MSLSLSHYISLYPFTAFHHAREVMYDDGYEDNVAKSTSSQKNTDRHIFLDCLFVFFPNLFELSFFQPFTNTGFYPLFVFRFPCFHN